MTDQDLKDMLADLLRSQAELRDSQKEADRQRKEALAEADQQRAEADLQRKEALAEADRQRAEADRQRKEASAEADRQIKEASAEADRQIKEASAEADRQIKEASAEADRQIKEASAETGRQIKEASAETGRNIDRVSKLVGDIGNKFGRFTEGMAEPSMRKLLDSFGMTAIHPRALFRSEDRSRTLEVDVLGYDRNDLREEVYIVEVKSLLTPEGITQALKTIADFRELGPVALRHRPVYGVIAAVDIPEGMEKAVARRGLYLARINDDTFQLLTPPDFKPRLFLYQTPPNGRSNGRANGRPKKKKSSKKRSTK